MAEPLEGREAYFAGINDIYAAMAVTNRAFAGERVPQERKEKFFRKELMHLWQARVDRGELPKDYPEFLEKAS